MKTIDECSIIEDETGFTVQFLDNDIDRESFCRMIFRLETFCSVPVLIFEFQKQKQKFILPVRFRPDCRTTHAGSLTITLQIHGQDCRLRHERMFELTPLQTGKMHLCSNEQAELTPGQLEVIEDYIYSDFIGILTAS